MTRDDHVEVVRADFGGLSDGPQLRAGLGDLAVVSCEKRPKVHGREHYYRSNVNASPEGPKKLLSWVIYPASNAVQPIAMLKPRRIEETRLINARALAGSYHGAIKDQADKIGKAPNQWQQTIGKTPTKNIGTAVAIEIEEAYGKPAGWMDIPWDMAEPAEREAVGSPTLANLQDLMESRKPKNIHAIQLVIGALAGMMLARRPDEVDEMIAGIRTALPKAYRTSGPGGAILSQLEEARKTIRGKGLRPSKPRGKR